MKRFALVLAAALALAGCQREAPPPPRIVVDGTEIDRAAYEREAHAELERQRRARGGSLKPGADERIREMVLRRMAEDERLARQARTLGITVPPADERAAFDAMRARRFPGEAEYREHLERTGHTEESLREEHRRQLLRDRVQAAQRR